MAEGINVTGKSDVKLQFAVGGGLSKLGESMDMIDIEERAFWHNVPGDRYGGPQGPPIDMQYLGTIYIVRMELSRWDPDVWDVLKKRRVQTTAGTIPLTDIGKLMFSTLNTRLLLHSTTRPLNFPAAFLRDPFQWPMGSKFSSLSLQFECHRCTDGTARDGILYNADTAAYV